MPSLVAPLPDVWISFLAAMAELRAEGRGGPADESGIGRELRTLGQQWTTRAGFESYVAQLRAEGLEETSRSEWQVPQTTLWLIEGQEYLGRLAIRHRLNDQLREVGGHIGYDVRPTARRRGYATAMLREALPVANRLGIDPALVTCDTTNVASRKVIEANGGHLEDERNGKLRFWVPTSGGPPAH